MLSAALSRLAHAAHADGALVRRFARTRDADAFAELVRRSSASAAASPATPTSPTTPSRPRSSCSPGGPRT